MGFIFCKLSNSSWWPCVLALSMLKLDRPQHIASKQFVQQQHSDGRSDWELQSWVSNIITAKRNPCHRQRDQSGPGNIDIVAQLNLDKIDSKNLSLNYLATERLNTLYIFLESSQPYSIKETACWLVRGYQCRFKEGMSLRKFGRWAHHYESSTSMKNTCSLKASAQDMWRKKICDKDSERLFNLTTTPKCFSTDQCPSLMAGKPPSVSRWQLHRFRCWYLLWKKWRMIKPYNVCIHIPSHLLP